MWTWYYSSKFQSVVNNIIIAWVITLAKVSILWVCCLAEPPFNVNLYWFHHQLNINKRPVFIIRSSNSWTNHSPGCDWRNSQVWRAPSKTLFSKLSVDCWGWKSMESVKWLLQIYWMKSRTTKYYVLLNLLHALANLKQIFITDFENSQWKKNSVHVTFCYLSF